MKKLSLIAIMVMAMAVLSQADPKITIPEERWDFGFAPQNSALTHDYTILNTGIDTLRIIRVKPG